MDKHYSFSNCEYVAMVQLYAKANYNSHAAQRLYAEPQHLESLRRRGILNPQVPQGRTIAAATQRLLEHGQFERPKHAQGRGRSLVYSSELDKKIIEYFEQDPRQSTRKAASRFGVSQFYVRKVLNSKSLDALEEDAHHENDALPDSERTRSCDSARSENEIKVFCPKCNTDVSHAAQRVQEDQRKILVPKVYHYFEKEYEELEREKMKGTLDLTRLSKFCQRTALVTGFSESTVLEILKEEEKQNVVKRKASLQSNKACKRSKLMNMSRDGSSDDSDDSNGPASSIEIEETVLGTPFVKKELPDAEEENFLKTLVNEELAVNQVPAQSDPLPAVVKKEPSDDTADVAQANSLPAVVKTEPSDDTENVAQAGSLSAVVKTEPSDDTDDVVQPQADPLLEVSIPEPRDDTAYVTAYYYPMPEKPVESLYLTVLPLPTRSMSPDETQDDASTSDTPFAEPPTPAAPKSSAQRQREYRQRLAASRTLAQSIATRKSDTERKRNYRLRKALTSPSSSRQPLAAETTVQPGTSDQDKAQSTWNAKWKSSTMRFTLTFLDNDFGYACSVCDRLWFKNDLKPITAAQLKVISDFWFIKENKPLCKEDHTVVCNTCKRSLNKKSIPPLAKVNGFSYPEPPPGLPPLDPISERLISPRLPFMQMRRLRHDSSYGITGQVINVPVDVQDLVKCLPRQLNEDDVINVNIERNLAHKSVYISEYMSQSTIKAWLDVLQESPLYRLYEINVDLSRLNPAVPLLDNIQGGPSDRIENISAENTPESEILASRQHTMIWDEEDCIHIVPGHQVKHVNIIYDRHAEELSFPSIYFGEPRRFNMGISLTHYMMAKSEIRRRDRRGATPQKILYVAMKILRLRMVNGIHNTFRNVSATDNVTRRMLEDTEFMKEYVIQNLAFMKTVPNSVQYWASRKRDLYAMIRQLGKPTFFLSISANEIQWMKLLTILLKLSNKYPGKTAKDLDSSQRCTLVSDDPVTCSIYFYRLIGALMKMLKSKKTYNPFDKFSVNDYFLRIEFQHHGSPQAHILLWLNDDPHETVSEKMPRTIMLVEKLSSVSRNDVPIDSVYANQIHEHTFTCTKQGETTCRFGIPFWPMSRTRVLLPMAQSDLRRPTLQQKAEELRISLCERRYESMDEFLEANSLTNASYLDIVRSTLLRPTLLFRRNFDELMTNTFNPYLAGEVNAKIDIQFILDDYSCADYVLEYIIKSTRGMSDLRRELTMMMQEHPERDYTGQLEALSMKLLNAVEMTAQEAAWYLLRQPMSETSRDVVYIPTVWPSERQRCRKRRQQMDREGIDGDSTNVWTKNIIQRYEERPASLENVYLAEFAAWYANTNDFVGEEDDVQVDVDDDEDTEGVPEPRTSGAPREYRRRVTGRVIRYRRYDIDETVNYKREMVLLYIPFRNEVSEIIDQNKFLLLFDLNLDTIMERRSLYETNLNIENVMKELEALMILQNDDNSNLQEEESGTAVVQPLGENGGENGDGVNQIVPKQEILIVEAQQCEVKVEVLETCTNDQCETTGDNP